ncbi:MAG TPA: hypothetical protein VGE04_13585, partial [Chloroflexia bacterium]
MFLNSALHSTQLAESQPAETSFTSTLQALAPFGAAWVGCGAGSAVSVGCGSGVDVRVGGLPSPRSVGVLVGTGVLLGRGVGVWVGGSGVLVGVPGVDVGEAVAVAVSSGFFVLSGRGVCVGGLPGVLVASGFLVWVGFARVGVTVAPRLGVAVAVGVDVAPWASALTSACTVAVEV